MFQGYDPTFLASVSEFLHLLKHQVWTYENPFIAFSALRVRRNFYDLIITDLYLPEMDGFEVQKRVREEFRLPLIMVSSDDRGHVIFKALKLGVAHYIVKPICFNDVKNLWKFVVNVDTLPSVNGFEFEASSNRFQTRASPLTNHLHGNSNHYEISAGFQYNNKFNNGSSNRTVGLMNDSYSLVTNNYYNGGLSVELTGSDSNPDLASSTGRIDTNFIGLVMNDIDRSEHHQDENPVSGREDASYVGFGSITNVQVEGSSSNDADVSQDPNEINADFNELYDMLSNDKKFEYLTQEEGKQAETSETGTNLIQEDALLKESDDQNYNNEVIEELEFDWFDLLDASAVLEDVSVDEDLTKFLDSSINN